MNGPRRIALVGFGRIASTEHRSALAASEAFELVAAVDPVVVAPNLPTFRDLESLLDSGPRIDAVALCQPPQSRFRSARLALRAGLHVLLEKPPGATVAEVESLHAQALEAGRTLFASWHSRFAPAVVPATERLAHRTVRSMSIVWRENVQDWHPGQKWVWAPGGFGVFNPGINALSVATAMLRAPLQVVEGTLEIPANQGAPIAAALTLETPEGVPVSAQFDWRKLGPPQWEITVATDRGEVKLTEGGSRLWCEGTELDVGPRREYPALYGRFAELIANRRCDVDLAPLRTVADAFLRCRMKTVEAFDEEVVTS